MSKIIKATKRGEKVGSIIENVITFAMCGSFAIAIIYFIYNFTSTIIGGGSFNI